MAKGKNVLTTGDVARICNVAPRTVSKWFDSGQLKGYRIPGSKDRRIPVGELMRFMKVHNMPTPEFGGGNIRVLIVDSRGNNCFSLAEELRHNSNYEVKTAAGTCEVGIIAQRFAPHVLLVNLLAEKIAATEICRTIREDEELQTMKVLAISNGLSESEAKALLQRGFDGYICNPADIGEIVSKIEETTAIVY